jgi:5-methyltetrahydrofolate--homocysteine methyltransferase
MVDYQSIFKRYGVFWSGGETCRPILHITVPDKTADWGGNHPKDAQERWGDLEVRYKWSRFCMENTKHYGEAMPQDWVNFGPGCLAAMMGSDYIFDDNTVWFGEGKTFLPDWSGIDDLRLLEDAPMTRMVEEMTRIMTQRSGGAYITGVSDLGGALDILASLRGTQDLLTDLYDYPDMVIRAAEVIDAAWITVYDRLRGMIRDSGQNGHTTWLGPWCETSYYPLQCDFSAMISPDGFEKFVLPSLERTAGHLDHSIYHWDGPGQIVHLDHLLSIERLDGIQWVPGDGSAPVWDEKWFPLYEKIQAAGKILVLHGFYTAEDALKVIKNFSPKGLWLSASFGSEEEAEELLAEAGG